MSIMKNVLIGLDQTINCVVKLDDGWGAPDETLSARAWRLRYQRPKLRAGIDRLFFWDENHCYQSYLSEMLRKHIPNDYR